MEEKTQELTTGLGIAVFGAVTLGMSLTNLPIGTLRSAGPGFFPACMGAVLILLGMLIAGGALLGKIGPRIYSATPDWRSLLMIALAIVGFIVGLEYFGLLLAIFLSTIIASFADHKLPFLKAVALGVGLAILAALIFRVGLGMYMPLVKNPFGV